MGRLAMLPHRLRRPRLVLARHARVADYFEWARDICDDFAVMDRGAIVLSGTRAEMNEAEVRGRMTV